MRKGKSEVLSYNLGVGWYFVKRSTWETSHNSSERGGGLLYRGGGVRGQTRQVKALRASCLCRKVSRHISALNRFKRLLPFDAKKKLYNSIIPSHLNYCYTVWHFCLKSDSDKIEKLNYERALRSVFQDKSSDYHC
jgi:hypothetical protein